MHGVAAFLEIGNMETRCVQVVQYTSMLRGIKVHDNELASFAMHLLEHA